MNQISSPVLLGEVSQEGFGNRQSHPYIAMVVKESKQFPVLTQLPLGKGR